MSRLLLVIALVGCKRTDPNDVDNVVDIIDYLGLEEDQGWTYRDDEMVGESPEEDALLRGRFVEGDIIDIRRGSRWADGDSEAYLAFEVDTHVHLVAWNMAGARGEGDLALGLAQPVNGQTVVQDDWFCATKRGALLATYYGVFEDIVQFDCSGDVGPTGEYTFARDVGLVYFEGGGLTLDLVAPW